MNTQQTTRRPVEANPFAQMIERMTGLARHWEIARDGNATAAIRHSLEESRLIVNAVIEREFEIAARTQRRLADRILSLSAARSPQEAWACQFDILALIADAGSEHSAAWADCWRSIRERCGPPPSAGRGAECDERSAHQQGSEPRSKDSQATGRIRSHPRHGSA